MELYDLEKAAVLFYAMCRNHPEICPHEFEFNWSQIIDDKKHIHYKCTICGCEKEVIQSEEG